MTYAEYKKQRQANAIANTQPTTNTQTIKTQPTASSYAEYKKQRQAQSNVQATTVPKSFNTREEALNYAKQNNIKLAGNTNIAPTTEYAQAKKFVDIPQKAEETSSKTSFWERIKNAGLTNEQAKYADELIDNNSLLSKGYELSKNAGNIAKASAKTLGVNALDSTVDVLQYAKNAFKSEMNGDKSEDLKLAIKLQNGFRGNQNQLTDEQANEFINYVKNKYNVSDFQNELNNINEWTYKENKLENATNELVSKVNEGNTELGKIGQRVANAFGTVGRMAPTIATNIVAPGLGSLPMYMSSAQASQDEALKNGASYDNAVANGKLKGALEVATEVIGGERIGKLTGIPTLTNKLGIHTGILGEIASEEIEEMLSTTVEPLIDRFTYNPNAPMATKEDYWNTFIDTALSTVLLMGVGKGIDTVTEYRDKAISKVNESNMSAEQKQQSISEIEKGANELIDKVKNNAQNSTNINENTSNIEQISQNNVQNVSDLEKSQQMSISDKQNRQATVTDEIQTFIENRNKIAPGLNVEMDNTLKTDGVIIKNSDGTRTIRVNPNSTRAYEFVVVHEMLHDLEGTQEYLELQKYVQDRANSHGNYEQAKQAITTQYENFYKANRLDMSNLDMNTETVNDMVAQSLGNQQFLNELAGNKPNVFIRMYNWVKNVLFDGQNTGKTFNERRTDNKYLQELKKKFERAYNTAYKSSAGEMYDIITTKDNKRFVKASRQVIQGNDVSNWGKQIKKYINEEIRKGQDVSVYGEDGTLLSITADTAGKATFRNEVRMSDGTTRFLTDNEYKSKLEAESHVDELAQVSKHKNGPVPDTKNHSFAKDGFNYRTAYFEDSDGKYYKITISVGKNGAINTIYNVGQMKEMQKNRSDTSNRGLKGPNGKTANGSTTSKYSIPSSDSTVNTQYMQNEKYNATQQPKTYKDIEEIESDISDNIDKATLIAGKNSNTRQKKRKMVSEYLENKYPNNEITFQINYDNGNVRVVGIYDKQSLKELKEQNEKTLKKEAEEYRRKHPETTEDDELELTYNEYPNEKQLEDIFDINNRIDELVQDLNRKGYDISVEHSKASADASYIDIETNEGVKQIRVANHYKSGVSGGNADVDINMNEYGSKNVLIEDIKKAISDMQNSEKNSQGLEDSSQSFFSNQGNTEWSKYLKENWDLMPNSKKTFAFPTNEQLQATDNKKISEDVNALNLKNKGKTEKTYKTNIERDSSIVEQKIKAIEKGEAKRDENAKRVSKEDIRKTIEDYTNQEMLTKHFRERAYGIYKPNTNTIRLEQRSDVETAIHELGHQIDMTQLKGLSQKTSAEVQTELKKICDTSFPKVYKKVSTKLQEGFAEATRMYIEDNENFVKTYPKTANLIQNELNNDEKLAKVFNTLTEQFHDYINMTPEDRVLSNVSFEGEETKPKLDWKYLRDKAIEWIYDDQISLKRLTQNIAKQKNVKVDDLTPSENITMALKLAEGLEDATISSLRNGYEEYGVKRTKGFKDILKGFDHEDIEHLVSYMTSEGNLDYIKANKQTGIRETDAEAVIKKYKDTKISKASEEIRAINDYGLTRLLQSGLITKEQAKSFRKINEHYVPMNRVIDRDGKIGPNTRSLQNGKIIKGRKGSDRVIINPLESTVVNNMRIDRQVSNNENLKNLVETLRQNNLLGEYIDEIPTPMQYKGSVELEVFAKELEKQGIDTSDLDLQAVYNIFTPKLSDDKNLIMSYMENGKRKYIQFKDKSLYTVINGLTGQKGLSTLEKFYSYFNNALRWGATAGNIDFSLPNMISDSQTAFLNSDATFLPIVDSMIGIIDTVAGNTADHPKLSKFVEKIAPNYQERKARLYELYEKSGAKNTTNRTGLKNRKNNLENVLGALAIDEKTLLGKNKKRPLKAVKKATEWAPGLSEEGTRFRNFEKELKLYEKRGMNLEDAIKKAGYNATRITQDFSQSGKATRAVNNLKPFTSAKISGTYQAYENFAKNPKRYSTRVALLAAASATLHVLVIQALMNGIGDKKEYEELQDQKLLDNYTIPIGDGKTITIKKVQGPVRAIINLAEAGVDYSMGMLDDKGLDKRLKAIANDIKMDNSYFSNATDIAGQAGTPILENALNKDFYYGNDLVPDSMEYLDNANKYDENTTETAKLLGKVFDYPPIYIDNLIEGYFAGVGTQALQMSDWVINKVSGNEVADRQASESFITKRFVADDYKNSQSVSEIYDTYDKLKNDEAEGRLTEEQQEQLNKIEQAKDTLSLINKEIRTTKTDTALNSKEKAEKIRELQKQKTDTARYYLGKETISEENKEQIELYEYYPTSTSKISSIIDADERNEYAQIVKDTYNFNLQSLKDSEEYKKASDKDKETMEASALTKAKNTAKEKTIQDNIEELVEERGEKETATLVLGKDNLEKYEKAKSAGIPLVDYYNAWLAQKNAEGKKNAFGKTISSSLKKAKIEAIQEATDLTTEQNKVLYGIFNLGK